MKKKTAIITGITGQDGAYLAAYLLQKGYLVVGLTRSYTSVGLSKLAKLGIENQVEIEECDLMDYSSIIRILQKFSPDEFYNLAAQSSVAASFNQPIGTIHFNAISVLNILEAIRSSNASIRFYQASSSEMFGRVTDLPIREESVLNPVSPYAISKATAHWIVRNYRDAYGIFACSGILFNHESPQRGETFLTRKVTRAAARIALGLDNCLYLGNLNAQRDWGHAKDYIEGMYLMLQQDKPEDFVLATGITTTIREFVKMTFAELGIELGFKGSDDAEEGYVVKNTGNYHLKEDQVVIKVDPKYYRPTEVDLLIGDPTKAMTKLGWKSKYDLAALVKEMVTSDLEIFKKELLLKENGYTITKESE